MEPVPGKKLYLSGGGIYGSGIIFCLEIFIKFLLE